MDMDNKYVRNSKNLIQEIDMILNDKRKIYPSRVEIKTRDGVFQDAIIRRDNLYLLTLSNKKILLSDIIDIKKLTN